LPFRVLVSTPFTLDPAYGIKGSTLASAFRDAAKRRLARKVEEVIFIECFVIVPPKTQSLGGSQAVIFSGLR
jgi:hypothetical protein